MAGYAPLHSVRMVSARRPPSPGAAILPGPLALENRPLSPMSLPPPRPLTPEEVLAALLVAPEDHIAWVLFRLAHARPDALRRGLEDVGGASGAAEPPPVVAANGGHGYSGLPHSGSSSRSFQSLQGQDAPASVTVTCPAGAGPGTQVCFSIAHGRQMQVSIPRGVAPGQAFTVPLGGTSSSRSLANGEANGGSSSAPVVQFSSFIFYCNEDEKSIELSVMRIGNCSRRTEVDFTTRDMSAIAGKTYEQTAMRLVFEPDEDSKTVLVPLYESETWQELQEFAVELSGGPEGLVNATLGGYLWTARVKVIDNDCFPSNEQFTFHDEDCMEGCDEPLCMIVKEQVTSASKTNLFLEYLRFNFNDGKVRFRSIVCALIDQLHNLFGFFQLFVNVYLVDYVLGDLVPDEHLFLVHSKEASLLLIMCANLIPFFFLHMLDHRKASKYGVGGTSRQKLQVALLRKFLNYDQDSRLQLRNGDLIMAMTRDSPALVSDGFTNVLCVVKEIGQLTFMLAYQFLAPLVFNKEISWLGFLPLLAFPVAMVCFLHMRNATTSSLLNERNSAQDKLVSSVEETVNNFRLIADFSQREKFIKRFDKSILEYNSASRETGVVLGNNSYFAKWLALIAILGWTVWGGTEVIDGNLSLGMFLANVNIFTKIGASWGAIFKVILEIATIFPALENVVVSMNLPTDLPTRKLLSRNRNEESKHLQVQLKASRDPSQNLELVDRMPIIVGNLTFTYITKNPAGGERITELNQKGILHLQQGEFAALVGPRGGGKSTLLKLIGGGILPSPEHLGTRDGESGLGQFFVPSHLRMLNVDGALFFEGTLLGNLVFGLHESDADARLERVIAVCKKLGISHDVLRHLFVDQAVAERPLSDFYDPSSDGKPHPAGSEEVCTWGSVFSATELQLLSIARALITNPNVLCFHKPVQLFDDKTQKSVCQVLKEFVQNRGIEQKGIDIMQRRPRTLIITTSADGVCLPLCDKVFHVSRETGISRLEAGAPGQQRPAGPRSLPID